MTRKYTKNPTFDQVLCECGCGETFMAPITTKKPRYKNDAHRKRASRKRKAVDQLIEVFGRDQVVQVFSRSLS